MFMVLIKDCKECHFIPGSFAYGGQPSGQFTGQPQGQALGFQAPSREQFKK